MKPSHLCSPLLTLVLTWTLCLIQVQSTTALQFPLHLPVTLVNIFQHYHAQPNVHTNEVDLEDFWLRARELGDKAKSYSEDLIKKAAERSQVVSRAVGEVKDRIHTIVRGATDWHEELNALRILRAQRSKTARDVSLDLDGITAELEVAFGRVVAELNATFPAPDHAPGHEERVAAVEAALDQAGAALLPVCAKYGMNEERTRVYWDAMRPAIFVAVVTIGDLAEQHPDLLEALLFMAAIAILPEIGIARPLLRLFGWGPTGPAKGSTAAWAQRVFYGAAVSKGSWFAKLQQAAMSGTKWWWLPGWIRRWLGL
ncbi:hypothetical protein FB45DRAFT_787914 [Roridomyces roridus]|uniref:Uncharacterized protein n=1 Tax=Roridomyces roridus TaxID=1738132 RepID=A0AAD7FU98_9AGAR|nr:hypothetical protein FB45DRAFT_787914 [Roridomyces roridus]